MNIKHTIALSRNTVVGIVILLYFFREYYRYLSCVFVLLGVYVSESLLEMGVSLPGTRSRPGSFNIASPKVQCIREHLTYCVRIRHFE